MAERVQVMLDVQGMTCDGCARHVERGLLAVSGVVEATVPTWQAGRATVIAGEGVSDEKLAAAAEAAGYRAPRAGTAGAPGRAAVPFGQ